MENYIPDWLMQAIVTVVVLPIISYSGNAFISKKFNKDNSHTQGKNVYRDFITDNSKPIDDLFYILDKYKRDTMKKYFFFIEGIPAGFIFSLILLMSSFLLSQMREFSKFGFFLPYHNYLNNGQKNTDLINIVLSLNVFSALTVVIIFLFIFFLYSQGYMNPKLTEKLSLKKWSKFVYYSYWFSMGLVIGLYMNILYFTIWFNDEFIRVIEKLPSSAIYILLSIYLLSFFISLTILFTLHREIKYFSNSFKQAVTDFYIDDFPNIRVKTNRENICGKIGDIHNESLLILNEGDAVKAIRWDQITTMEIEKQVDDSK